MKPKNTLALHSLKNSDFIKPLKVLKFIFISTDFIVFCWTFFLQGWLFCFSKDYERLQDKKLDFLLKFESLKFLAVFLKFQKKNFRVQSKDSFHPLKPLLGIKDFRL